MFTSSSFFRNLRCIRTLHHTSKTTANNNNDKKMNDWHSLLKTIENNNSSDKKKSQWKEKQLKEMRIIKNPQRKLKFTKFPNDDLDLEVRKIIEQVYLAAHEEREEKLERERLQLTLPEDQLELRGLALTDVSIDHSHCVSRPGGELDIRVKTRKKAAPITGAVEWRKGRLVQLEVMGIDFKQEGWGMVTGVIVETGPNWVILRISHLDPFILDCLQEVPFCVTVPSAGGKLRLIKRSSKELSDTSIKSMTKLMSNRMNLDKSKPAGVLFRGILSQEYKFVDSHPRQSHSVTLYNQVLKDDPSKMVALSMCSNCPPVCAIHGPPGTGKTTTLAAAVLSSLAQGEKVLVVAPSNAACDAVTTALAESWPGNAKGALVRLTKELRLTVAGLHQFLPDRSEELEWAEDEVAKFRTQLLEGRGKGRGDLLKGELEASNVCRQIVRDNEDAAVESAQVIVATLTVALKSRQIQRALNTGQIHLVALDEAGFTLDSDFLPLLDDCWKSRIIMAGDHQQLPPVVFSDAAKERGLGVSLFERFVNSCPDLVVTLSTQYRSNKAISEWSSQQFYKGVLETHERAEGRSLEQLQGIVHTGGMVNSPLIWIDTVGCNCVEEEESESDSYCNFDEAVFVTELVEKYQKLGVPLDDIGVITPYWAQVGILRGILWQDYGFTTIEISTVDGYQGREKELIIISLVRSNEEGDVGFLSETRRINVSVTRAKRCCIIVGDSGTLTKDKGLDSLYQHCKKNNFVYPVNAAFI